MVNRTKWHLLQLFAGEAAAGSSEGENAGSVVNSADDGHRSLQELGVPENLIRKHRAYAGKNSSGKVTSSPQQAAAAENIQPGTEEIRPRMSWEEIKKDPDYNAQIQKIVQARVREGMHNRQILEALDPALKHLAKLHGLDSENLDHAALARAITGDPKVETAPRADNMQQTEAHRQIREHIRNLEYQGQSLKQTFPHFDLRKEMRDPVFARLVSPSVNLSVEDAYHAVHRREIQAASMQAAARRTAQQIADAIQSGSRRPDESGASGQASSVTTFDYRKASRAEREALKQRLRQAAARGEKVYPE